MDVEKIKKVFFSLRFKFVIVLVVALLISYGAMSLTTYAFDYYLINYYSTQEKMEERDRKYQESFKEYVKENNISSTETKAINRWVKEQNQVMLGLCDETGKAFYESGISSNVLAVDDEEETETTTSKGTNTYSYYANDTETTATESSDTSFSDENAVYYDTAYLIPVEFFDGTFYASVIDVSSSNISTIGFYSSYLVFIVIFFAIVLAYNYLVNKRIIRLSKEVSKIKNGNLDSDITKKGRDEIEGLAKDVDNMREFLISRIEESERAWEANKELITNMSHDIRTPLTSLIGYVDIIEQKNYDSEEQRDSYIKTIKSKALQLKSLSDKLFSYFLVFGDDEINMLEEKFDTRILLQQLIGERVFDLENKGYKIDVNICAEPYFLNVDIQYFQRVFDNLFSNISKYADISKKVVIDCSIEDDILTVTVNNKINKNLDRIESNNIGLKICQKIVKQMHGTFEIENDGDDFTVTVTFPVEKIKEESVEN